MERIAETKWYWEPRGNTIHQALEYQMNQRFNPNPPPNLKAPVPGECPKTGRSYAEWIDPLLNDPLWDEVQVVGTEIMGYLTRRNVAGTADLVVKFPDNTYGIADLKTQSEKSSGKYCTKSQLGAGVEMIGDHYRLPMSRCLTLWSQPGRLVVQPHDAQACLDKWFDTCLTYERDHRPF